MKRPVAIFVLSSSVAALTCVGVAHAQSTSVTPANNVIAHALDVELGRVAPRPKEAKLSSGVVYAALLATGAIDQRVNSVGGLGDVFNVLRFGATQGCPNTYTGLNLTGFITNTRVNQDCSLRRQAETVVAINPTDWNNLIAGQNDSRLGFNKCGYDWSNDGGKSWGDQVPPFYQFIMRDGHTADACSDPTATFDSLGNAYIAGVLFQINSAASALVVAKSNAGIKGAYYHTPANVPFQEYQDLPLGVVASDNNPNIIHDKEFIVADAGSNSPKKNNVYATWTRFDVGTNQGVGGHSPIYFSQSRDGGATWSPGIEISGSNNAICNIFSGEADRFACDQDQGSHPIVGPDGNVYVTFGNGNTPTAGINQVLFVSCPANKDCSNRANWTAPVKVGDLFDYQPVGPNTLTGCSGGRQCLPPNGYRMDDFVEISGAVDNAGRLYVTWADGRNLAPNCMGSAATATPPCDNDVFYAYSTNGGVTWSATKKVTQPGSAQWMPWSAAAPDGSALYIAYYDRSYGNCEFTGCNDITLATVRNAATASPTFTYKRITTSSMPNLIPSNNPVQAGFLGDYMWVATDGGGTPHVVWSDTRGQNGAVEEDIYFYKGK